MLQDAGEIIIKFSDNKIDPPVRVSDYYLFYHKTFPFLLPPLRK